MKRIVACLGRKKRIYTSFYTDEQQKKKKQMVRRAHSGLVVFIFAESLAPELSQLSIEALYCYSFHLYAFDEKQRWMILCVAHARRNSAMTIKTFFQCVVKWRWKKIAEKVMHEICYTASKNNAKLESRSPYMLARWSCVKHPTTMATSQTHNRKNCVQHTFETRRAHAVSATVFYIPCLWIFSISMYGTNDILFSIDRKVALQSHGLWLIA